MSRPKIIYLAHPVGAATDAGVQANLGSARAWLGYLIANCPNVAWCAPWLPYLDVLKDTPANRERGLRDDCAMVAMCDAILLVGRTVSPGMMQEAAVITELGRKIIDCTDRNGSSLLAAVSAVNEWVASC